MVLFFSLMSLAADPMVVTFEKVGENQYTATYSDFKKFKEDEETQLGAEETYSMERLAQIMSEMEDPTYGGHTYPRGEDEKDSTSLLAGQVIASLIIIGFGGGLPSVIAGLGGSTFWHHYREPDLPLSENQKMGRRLHGVLYDLTRNAKKVEIQTPMAFPFVFRKAEKRRLGLEASGVKSRDPAQERPAGT